MNKNVSEIIKVAEALDGATTDVRTLVVATDNTDTDRFYAPGIERKLCFVVTGVCEDELIDGTLLEGETVTLALLEATSSAGAGSRPVTGRDGVTPITTTLTGALNTVQAILFHSAVYAANDNFTLNGVNFTFDGAGYDADLRPLSYLDRDEIVTAVNARFTEITASNGGDANAVLFTSTNPGQVGVTLAEDIGDANAFAASTHIVGYVDVDASQLDTANSFDFAGINILNSSALGDIYFNCLVLMGDARYNPAPGPGR